MSNYETELLNALSSILSAISEDSDGDFLLPKECAHLLLTGDDLIAKIKAERESHPKRLINIDWRRVKNATPGTGREVEVKTEDGTIERAHYDWKRAAFISFDVPPRELYAVEWREIAE